MLKALPLVLGLTLVGTACGDEESPTPNDPVEDASKPKDAGRDARNTVADTGPKDAGPPDTTLEPLAGRYLIRFDTLGTATSPAPAPLTGDIAIRSRVSNLIVTELTVEGDHLVGKERLCTQAIEQRCEELCSTAVTTVDSRTVKNFLLKQFQQRNYTVDGDSLKAEQSVATLGYTDEDVDNAAPTSSDDDRVWDVDDSKPVREGYLTQLKVTLSGIPLPLTCAAYGTQKFVSAFSGTVNGDQLEFGAMNLVLEDSEAHVLGANPASCSAEGAESPVDVRNARMVRYGEDMSEDAFWNCPTQAVFDAQLTPTPL